MSARNTSAVHWQTTAIARTSSSTSSALAPTTASQARATTIAGTSSSTSAFESPPAGRASTTRSSTPIRPSYAAPRAPDVDLMRLLADGRSAIICPPQDARSAIARPPQDADAPDGYFAGYCVVV